MANLGWDEVRLPNPLFEGDTVYSRSEVLEKRESKSRPERRHRPREDDRRSPRTGKIVIEFLRTFMVYKRGHVPQRGKRPEPRANERSIANERSQRPTFRSACP